MDDVQQLSEMLRHYADSEAHKKQQLDIQSARWTHKLDELFQQIEHWLEPVKTVGLLEVGRQVYTASGPSVPVETSTFKTQKLTVQITGKTVEFVPDVMGAGGSISIAVLGLTAARHGSVSLVLAADKNDWLWKKTNGLKDPDTFGFDANFLAAQLQSLIPRDRA
ncbi:MULTISPECIES: hypothetical protein [unclassified Pseudomonas]|uniref:hypothetical protein n=1 Tax=unclassified Pseudomonas TaxID=196821 RepID=UPI002002D160|nr:MULTISPECIES: hypothetical protein [unclassified Pseudomonas]MCK6189215.1 hypothetical protein [Pseudomonas sp. EYE_354]WLH66205.1 hypothetical protein PSH59_13680 [Pseudomonas sp. FP2309]